jgi:hypothetical protein
MLKALLGTTLLLSLAGWSGAQTIQPVCYESFDYAPGPIGGPGGGTGGAGGAGWLSAWWSGGNGDDAVVSAGSIDAVGNRLTTNIENGGSYRQIDMTAHPNIAPSLKFGSADGVLWVRFYCQRVAGTSDVYGGLSLWEAGLGERIFIGSPGDSFEWGLEEAANPANRATVPGSNIDQVAQLVVKVTHAVGASQVDLWVDPATAYPTGTPQATISVADYLWNEIRIQSGANQGGTTGYDFDEVVIEKEVGGGGGGGGLGTNYCTTSPNSSGPGAVIGAVGSATASLNFLTLNMTGLPQGQFCLFIASRQAGFVANPGGAQGNLCVGSPIARFGPAAGYSLPNSGTTGTVDQLIDLTSIPLTPAVGVLPGETWYFQGWYRDNNPGPVSNFSDGLSITFQ